MKKILKYIPGFRTEKRWIKALSIAGYLFALIFILASKGMTSGDTRLIILQKLITFLTGLMMQYMVKDGGGDCEV